MTHKSADYTGRFAPSPTGHLHFGSLIAALGSYCDTRQNNGNWLVRIDDIDPPRELAGAADGILDTLLNYGFEWDQEPLYQSTRSAAYQAALAELESVAKLYPCNCSRKSLLGYPHYPGFCRNTTNAASRPLARLLAEKPSVLSCAMRLNLADHYAFNDRIQGQQSRRYNIDIGDPILLRRDRLFSYALACAIDDSESITHVVRGADLIDATIAQIAIMQALQRPQPEYAHLPVAMNHNAQKLSKQTLATPLHTLPALPTLKLAWHSLRQPAFDAQSVAEFWNGAFKLWDIKRVPAIMTFSLPTDSLV